MSPPDSPRRLERYDLPPRLAQAVLFGIGGLLAGVYLYDLALEWGQPSYPVWVSLLENGPGLGLSGSILVLTRRLSTTRQPPIYFSKTAKGCLIGFVSALGVGLFLLALRQIRGEGSPMVYLLAAIGAFSGTVIGYVQARRGRVRKRLRSITENLSEGIYRSAPGEGIVYANQAFAEMFGFESPENLMEVDPATLYDSPEHRDRLREKSRVEGGFEADEVTLRRRDGSTFTGRLSGTVKRGPEGEVKYYDGVVADISERKEAEQALREREARLRGLANSIPGVVFQFYARPSGERGLHFVSEHAESVLGISAEEEGFYERFVERVPSSHREAFVESIGEAVEDEKYWQQEVPFETPSGERIWLFCASTPERQEGPEGGDEIVFNGVVLDVTDQKEAERALREERDRFQTLFESLPTPVVRCLVREDGNIIIDVNEAFEAVFGVDASAAEGTDIDELIVPEDRREEAAEIAQRAVEKGWTQAEVRRRTADGLRDFQLQIAGRAPEEAPPEVYIIYTDITEQKEQERRLKEAKQEAEEANRVKSAFLANMSHEIRTPLTSIIGFAEAIGREASGEEGLVSRFADRIHKGGQRLLETLDAVLNLSKLEAGEMRLAREPVDLTGGAEAVAEELHPRAEEAGVDLAVESPDSPVRAEGDEGGVQITVQNLVTNAIKYTESGGRVRIRTYREGGQAVLEVEDTGIGMDPEVAEALFEPFRQATGGPGRVYEGTGVGLAVTKRAVEQMEGHIEVDTEKGKGSRFTVRLPRSENSGEA